MGHYVGICHSTFVGNKNKDSAVPDYLIKIHKPDCEEYNEFQEGISSTVKITLNVIVACWVSMPAEE